MFTNQPFFIKELNIHSTLSYKSKKINESNSLDPITDLFAAKIQQDAFNLLYIRLQYGKYFYFKIFSLKNLLINSFLNLLGFSRINWYCFLLLIRIKNYDALQNFIYNLAYNPFDDRIVLKINNEWYINNGHKKEMALNYIWKNFFYANGTPDTQKGVVMHKLNTILAANNEMTHESADTQLIQFRNKNLPQTIHYGALLTKNPNSCGYATDFNRAEKFNFYEKTQNEILIPKFHGPQKLSTSLYIDEKDYIITKELGKSKLLAEKIGLALEKNKSSLLNEQFVKESENLKEITDQLQFLLIEFTTVHPSQIQTQTKALASIIGAIDILNEYRFISYCENITKNLIL